MCLTFPTSCTFAGRLYRCTLPRSASVEASPPCRDGAVPATADFIECKGEEPRRAVDLFKPHQAANFVRSRVAASQTSSSALARSDQSALFADDSRDAERTSGASPFQGGASHRVPCAAPPVNRHGAPRSGATPSRTHPQLRPHPKPHPPVSPCHPLSSVPMPPHTRPHVSRPRPPDFPTRTGDVADGGQQLDYGAQ